MSDTAILRHREHIPEVLSKAQVASEVARADGLLGSVIGQVNGLRRLHQAADELFETARREGETEVAIKAINSLAGLYREERGTLELLGKVTGELTQFTELNRPQVVILMPSMPVRPSIAEGGKVIDATPLKGGTTE